MTGLRRVAHQLLGLSLLAGLPMMALAQQLEWAPLTMDFPAVPVTTTETQTLTLTHSVESTGTLTISAIEFTFNQQDTFDFALPPNTTLPVDLLPGESLEVEISFTPVEFSFALAELLITNNSENAPSLAYSLLGDGVETVATEIVAAVLPGSRSVQVGDTATAFASIINAGNAEAVSCSIFPTTPVDAAFLYQTTDPATNELTGTPNTPANIPAGASQSFLVALTPNAALASTLIFFNFDCTNTNPAPTDELNALQLVADNNPVPDVIALAATVSNDGITSLAPDGAFAVATVNVGASADIIVSASSTNASLPLSIALCETQPSTGACINPTAPTTDPVTTTIVADATPTFSFFISSSGPVPFDPANNRILVQFEDGDGISRGATSVAVRGEE